MVGPSRLAGVRLFGLLLLATPVAALAQGVSIAHADTFYVAADGSDVAGDGSIDRPFGTIQYAVNSGLPAAGGHEVVVRDGVYEGGNTLRRGFTRPVTVRAEHPYQAVLTNVAGGREVIRVYIAGRANIVLDGFMLTNADPTHNCDSGRERHYLVHLQDVSAVTLTNSILFGNSAPGTCNEILKINRSRERIYPREIFVSGNVFYDPANAGGADLIDSVRPGEITISDNIFFSRPDWSRSQSFITLKRQAPAADSSSPRFLIARNIFLNWGGKADQAFIQLGEDGVPEPEITDALIENNLVLGNSPARLAAPMQFKGARQVLVRANTVIGDLPSGAYGFRIGTEVDNPQVRDIRIVSNIWSDPTGTFGQRLVNAYGDVDLTSVVLERNLFWNGGGPLPTGGDVPLSSDLRRVVADPGLPTDPAEVVLPRYDVAAGRFASGSRTIREEFLRLVETYARLAASSAAVDAADAAEMPSDDIRGLPRDSRPDIGAYEFGASQVTPEPPTPTPRPTTPPSVSPSPDGRHRSYLPLVVTGPSA